MCLAVISIRQHPTFELVIASNRDEFFDRPAASARFWEDHPDLLAGRDLRSSGTWLGVTRTGKVALLTNYRDPTRRRTDAISRGRVTVDFLAGNKSAADYLKNISAQSQLYNDFNLIVGERSDLHFYSTRQGCFQPLSPGVYGISNHLLDSPWPKVLNAKTRVASALLNSQASLPVSELFEILTDSALAPDHLLPQTGVGLDWERSLSSIFVKKDHYGTRSSTVVGITYTGEVQFFEVTYPEGSSHSTIKVEYSFGI